MKTYHLENCEAPICAKDTNPNFKKEVVWFPGEGVCRGKPTQKFVVKQLAINRELKKGTFRNVDIGYNALALENSSI